MMSRLVSFARGFRINARQIGAMLLALMCTAASVADVTYEYDEAGRLRRVIHDNGMVTTYVLDAAGNRTSVTTGAAVAAGAIQFSSATYSITEAGTTVTITATRTGGTSGAIGVTYGTSSGSATSGSDYTAASGTLSWVNGDSANKTFTVTILDDSAVESSETVNLALTAPTGGATLGSQSTAVLTITDNDSASAGSIQFSSATYSVTEAGTTVTITATRTGGTSGAVGATYGTSNGSATSGSDYTAASGTLSWSSGDSANKTFTVAILDDSSVEGSESVNLALTSPSGGATLGSPATAVLTIADNDSAPVGSIQFSSATYSVSEAGTAVTITATRTGGTNGAVGATYATSNGTATVSSDYTAASGTLSWANGDSASKTFTVAILEDSSVEGSETVNLALSAPTGGATLGSQSTAVLTITDNDNPPAGSIQFTASATSVAENGSSITITASRIGGSFGAVGATYNTANGTATSAADYTSASGTLSWVNGDTSNKSFAVTILDDSVLESAETFVAGLSAPTGGANIGSPATITVTINENDAGPVFSIANVTVSESAGTATLTVTKTGNTSLTHAVNYATAAGTAAAGSDFTTTSSSLSFAAGETSKTFTVPILDDTSYEGIETFTVGLSGATNGATVSAGAGTATVSINDNEGGPVFSIANVTVSEAAGTATLTVTKAGSTTLTHGVNYATTAGTATAGADYTTTSSSLSFAAGETSKTFTVPILDDTTYEGIETFTVGLSGATNSATVSGSAGTATVSIDDNEGGPVFSIAGATPAEASGGIALTITKTGSSSLTHSVNYATAAGTATAGADYTTVSSSISFSPGESSKTINIPILEDSAYEGNETFTVGLSGATNGATVSGGAGTATVTIVDNDSGPVFSIASVSPGETAGSVTLTVTKSGSTTYTHDVSFATSNAAAVAGADYTATSGSLSFAPGVTSQTLSVQILDDSIYEGSENFYVTLSGATSGASVSGSNGQATVTIGDNDSPPVFTVNTAAMTVSETVGSITVTAIKSGATAFTHNVNYMAGNITAVAGSDFTAVSGTFSFAPGETSKTITVPIINDAAPESSETFAVSLWAPTVNATIGTPDFTTVTITDDDPTQTITISDMTLSSMGFPSASTAYYLQSNGVIGGNAPGGLYWITPQTGMANYEVRASIITGTVCEGLNWGEWVSLGSNRGWSTSAYDPNGGMYTEGCTIHLDIRAAANPSVILGSANIDLSATVN